MSLSMCLSVWPRTGFVTHPRLRNQKNKNKSVQKQKKAGRQRQVNDICLSKTCLTNAVSFMKILKDKATNYKKQNARIKASKKQAGGKAGKKSIFKVLIHQIREVAGGNGSDLKCNGKSDNNGAKKFMNLTNDLKTCEADINSACNATLPTVYRTSVAECLASIAQFEALTTSALAATGQAACALWQAEVMVAAAAQLKHCSLAEANKKFTKLKKACTKAFGRCRKHEDEVGGLLSGCSPANSPEALQAALSAGVKNAAAAAAVTKKVAEVAAATTQTAAIACGTFTVLLTKAAGDISAAPLLPGLAAILEALAALTVAPCTAEEKTVLMAARDAFNEGARAIDEAIEEKQSGLYWQGGTAGPGVTAAVGATTVGTISAAATNAEATTAAATTTAKITTIAAATMGGATTAAATTTGGTTAGATTVGSTNDGATTPAATTADLGGSTILGIHTQNSPIKLQITI